MGTALFEQGEPKLNGAMTPSSVKLDLKGGEVLVQGFNFTWQQAVTRLYEIGQENNVYHVGGRCQGQATAARVLGPSAEAKQLYDYGDVCTDHTINFNITSGGGGDLCPAAESGFSLNHVVLVSVGVSVQAQDMIINEQCQFMFSGCKYR